jgi:shikimate kinase
MRAEIVLIGPVAAGKSAVGALVSHALRLPHVDMDKVGDAYYEAAGFPLAELDRRMAEDFFGAYTWAKASLPFAVEGVLRDHSDCVFSLGAIHTHFEEPELFARTKAALSPFEHVVLLLSSADEAHAVGVLRDRSLRQRGMSWIFDGYDFFERWVRGPCNGELATHVVYTDGRTPEQTRDDVLAITRPATA